MGDTNCQIKCWGGGGEEGEGRKRGGRAGSNGISPHIGRKAIQGLCADF